MEKIRFITDSASDMNNSREDVTILPLHIRFGEENMLTVSPSVIRNSMRN